MRKRNGAERSEEGYKIPNQPWSVCGVKEMEGALEHKLVSIIVPR